jgi:hypothetical protein
VAVWGLFLGDLGFALVYRYTMLVFYIPTTINDNVQPFTSNVCTRVASSYLFILSEVRGFASRLGKQGNCQTNEFRRKGQFNLWY